MSLNLKRRDLTKGQRAAIGLEIVPMLEEEAKKRQLATLKQNSSVSQKIDTRTEAEGRSKEQAVKIAGPTASIFMVRKRLKSHWI